MAYAEQMMKKHNRKEFRMDRKNGFMQLSPACALLLKGTGMEMAVSYNVCEMREGEICVRELRLDIANADDFDASAL